MIKNVNKKLALQQKVFIERYISDINHCLASLDKRKIALVIEALIKAYKEERKIFILGNGGAASTASHMACDLSKGTLQKIYDSGEKRFRVISLTDNVALMTAFANDISFEDIFVQQLRNLVEKDDIVFVLSGSGNSLNVIKAVEYAKVCGALTIGILGFKTGGKLGKIVEHAIIIDSNNYGPVEDIQLILNHIIASWIAKVKNYYDEVPKTVNENKAVPFS